MSARAQRPKHDERTHQDLPDPILDVEPERVLDKAVSVGDERLSRSPVDVLITAVIGGVEVSLGSIAAAVVLGATLAADSRLGLNGGLAIAAVVFPIGFVFVVIGRSELFTENFLIPVVAVTNGERTVIDLLRLWVLAWVGNIAGCAALSALVSVPDTLDSSVMSAYAVYADHKLASVGTTAFASAVLAGVVMKVMTWLLVAVRGVGAKIAVLWAGGYTLFAANLSHAVVGSSLVFVGFWHTSHGWNDLAGWLGVTTAGNLVGGVGFVTAFRLAQTWEKGSSG